VVIEGTTSTPGTQGQAVNAVRVAAAIVERLPREFLPETTELRQPYLHPYDLRGDVTRVEIKLLVRAFTEAELRGVRTP